MENDVVLFNENMAKEFVGYRKENSNKGDFGYVAILGGSINYTGAVKLASLSLTSIRAGSGVTRIIIPRSITNLIVPLLLEQTVFEISDKDSHMIFSESELKEALRKIDALAIGMGWGTGDDNIKILKYILDNYSFPILIDADGLNTLSKMDLDILNKTKCKVILTPHLKEFERLTKVPIEKIKEKKEKIAKEFAKKYNVILLLKGHTTIVTDGNVTYLVKKGGAGMATAGSGDVLSGIILGFLGSHEVSAKLIASSAYIAGLAGELAEEKYTDISMKASDTIEFLPQAIKEIRCSK